VAWQSRCPDSRQRGGGAGQNNWGNIRSADGQFRSFATPQQGMDALVSDVSARIAGKSSAMSGKYGAGYIPTIEKLISTYAPSSENDTSGYIKLRSSKPASMRNAHFPAPMWKAL